MKSFKEIAKPIARDLFAKLKAGELPKIGRDEVVVACQHLTIEYGTPDSFEDLIGAVCREVVEISASYDPKEYLK